MANNWHVGGSEDNKDGRKEVGEATAQQHDTDPGDTSGDLFFPIQGINSFKVLILIDHVLCAILYILC